MDEAESSVQEEVRVMVRRHILNMLYFFVGFVPATFNRLHVCTLDDSVVAWMLRRQLLVQCIDNLKATGSKIMQEAMVRVGITSL